MSLGIMGTSAVFAQVAGRAGKGEPVGRIELFTQFTNPTIEMLSGTDVVVNSIVSGQPHTDTYASLNDDELLISADANTKIVIYGNITGNFILGQNSYYSVVLFKNTKIVDLDCVDSIRTKMITIKDNNMLERFNCGGCLLLEDFIISDCDLIQSINCGSCVSLNKLSIKGFPALSELICEECKTLESIDVKNCGYLFKLSLTNLPLLSKLIVDSAPDIGMIYYVAYDENVSNTIADLITNSSDDAGELYTDAYTPYYQTIADAATAKGWTIEQLQ